MEPTHASYIARRRGEKDERRHVFDVKTLHLWLVVIAIASGWLGSAAIGVIGTANVVVPPICRKTMEPEIRKIEANAADIKANANLALMNSQRIEGDIRQGDKDTADALRQDMATLQHSLDETTRVMHELLLKLPEQRVRQKSGS